MNIRSSVPNNMAPNGYLLGSHIKLKTVSTRKHERYNINVGTCLIQDVSSSTIFRAEVVDISAGGMKLSISKEANIPLNASVKPFLKIVEHAILESPIPITNDFIKVLWNEDHVFGCSFISSAS